MNRQVPKPEALPRALPSAGASTHALLLATAIGVGCLALIGGTTSFWVASTALVVATPHVPV